MKRHFTLSSNRKNKYEEEEIDEEIDDVFNCEASSSSSSSSSSRNQQEPKRIRLLESDKSKSNNSALNHENTSVTNDINSTPTTTAASVVTETNTNKVSFSIKKPANSKEEEDALDAYMANINQMVNRTNNNPEQNSKPVIIEKEDHALDSYIMMKQKNKGKEGLLDPNLFRRSRNEDNDEEVYAVAKAIEEEERRREKQGNRNDILDYDSLAISSGKKQYNRSINYITPIDHSKVHYSPFKKNFYKPDSAIESLSSEDVDQIRQRLEIRVGGFNIPKPVQNFKQFGFDSFLLELINRQGFLTPTPIQTQAIPAILSGRDIIGLAKTGSGKTCAYVWPMIAHIMDQEELKKGEGPIALILCPTRELCQQIHSEVKKYVNIYDLYSTAIFGGESKTLQCKELKKGVDIVIATPGRLIDLIQLKACTLRRVTYLVLDEANQMFTLGFETQIRSIIGQVRPDRQMLMFSATFSSKIENLIRDTLDDPIKIAVGSRIGGANSDITQSVVMLESEDQKWGWLARHIDQFLHPNTDDKNVKKGVLVFVTRKEQCDELAIKLNQIGFISGSIHGDKSQEERQDVINAFRKEVIHILVATDVASRGLDIPHVKTVVNYEVAKDIESHIHRIGRTGRAGDKLGVAYTLITASDIDFAPKLVKSLESADQFVPDSLLQLAMKNPRYYLQRQPRQTGNNNLPSHSRWNHFKYKDTSGLGIPEKDEVELFISSSKTSSLSNFVPGRSTAIQSLQRDIKSQIRVQFQSIFVKKGIINADTEYDAAEPKKFEIIPAKKPNPISKEDRERFLAMNNQQIRNQQSAIQQQQVARSTVTFNVPDPGIVLQQQLILQQYQAFLSRREADKNKK